MSRCSRLQRLSAGLFLIMGLTLLALPAGGSDAAPVCPKASPAITFSNLSPPYKDYDYFQNHHRFPFAFNASSFSLVNAWWLAEASMLVYADEAYVNQRFHQAGLDYIRFFNRSSTQCFVAANDRFAIIAFRGSEIWKRGEPFDPGRIVADLATNIDVRLTEWNRGGRVHNGFKTALDEVWDELQSEIVALQAQGLKIWVTGHSLGGALATLAADRLAEVQGVYTFGSPRVGDDQFQATYRPKAFRLVNGRDIVARVPPKGPFYHVGALIPIDSQGRVQYRHLTFGIHAVPLSQNVTEGDGQGREHATSDSAVWIPHSMRDHVPLLYAIPLWNALVARRNATNTP